MKKLVVMVSLLIAGMTATAQVFYVTKHKNPDYEVCNEKRISVYSNLFVNKRGEYTLRVNSLSDNSVYYIGLGDSKESAAKSLEVLSFFVAHENDTMGYNYNLIADSVINVKDMELTTRDIQREKNRLK